MKYAVIQTGGKQYRVSEGDILEVEQLPEEKDQKVTFSDVLLYTNEGNAKIGTPHVAGMSVAAVVVEQVQGDKIRVAKYKAKSRYRKVIGHRQQLTKVKIETILDPSTSSGQAGKSQKTAEEKPATKESRAAKTKKA